MTTSLKTINFRKNNVRNVGIKKFCPIPNFTKIEKQKKDKFIDTKNEICLSILDIGLDYIYKECIEQSVSFGDVSSNDVDIYMSAFFGFKSITNSSSKFSKLFTSKFKEKTDNVMILSPSVLVNKNTFQRLKRFENTNYFEMYQIIDTKMLPIIFNNIDNNGLFFPYIPKNVMNNGGDLKTINNIRSIIGFFNNCKLVSDLKSGVPYEIRFQNIIVNDQNENCIKIDPDCFLPINMSILNPSIITDKTFKQNTTLVSSSDFLDSINPYNSPLVVKLYLREYYTLTDDSVVENICTLNEEVDMRCVKGMYNFLTTFNKSTNNFQQYYVTLNACVDSNSQNFDGTLIFWLVLGIIFGVVIMMIIFDLINSAKY